MPNSLIYKGFNVFSTLYCFVHFVSLPVKEISSETASKSSERILDLIKNKPTISAAEIAMEIDMSSRGVENQIKKLREAGIIKRNGADFGGYWEIVNLDND